MKSGLIGLIVSLLALAVTVGCRSVLKPSDQARRDAYLQSKNLFQGDQEVALRHTYFVFSGDSDLQRPRVDRETQKLLFAAVEETSIGQGLAIALEADGYLLTAGHVLGATNFVYGWFDGRIDIQPASLIFIDRSKPHVDLAVIKTAGNLDSPIAFGETPKIGDPAFAVVCYQREAKSGGDLGFTAGTVLGIRGEPSGSTVDFLVDTDLPLWEGDSGGPLLSSTGQLIGVTTGYDFKWYGVNSKYRRIAFLPNRQFVRDLIVGDRVRNTTVR